MDILLVDGESTTRHPLGDALRASGHRVRLAGDGAEASAVLNAHLFDIVICDIHVPKIDGITIFRRLKSEHPATEVLLMTAAGTIPDAVAALKEGAADYVLKPFDVKEMVERVARLVQHRGLQREIDRARRMVSGIRAGGMVGKSPAIARLLRQVDTFAPSDAPVLITGESGTGKELAAQILHERSGRRAKPFIIVHCAAFPENLIEAELFGCERGALPGIMKTREGRFKAAHGGTLFLDEVAHIPPAVQAKLLRVVLNGIVEPIGGKESSQVDVRLISATHQDLRCLVTQGLFREDLYYRLNVLDLEVPPLRERRVDLPILVEYLLQRYSTSSHAQTINPRALAALAEYSFPGNVRELEHTIQRAVVLAQGKDIDLEHLPPQIAGRDVSLGTGSTISGMRPLAEAVQEFEREYLLRALKLTRGRKLLAAEVLGVSRKSLWKKLRQLGISESEYRGIDTTGDIEIDLEDE
jgi:DNA-binding NtrC family response regulator